MIVLAILLFAGWIFYRLLMERIDERFDRLEKLLAEQQGGEPPENTQD